MIPLPGTRQGETDGEGRRKGPDRTTRAAPEPEFVQLLTPEGERVDHPDYTVDFTDEEYRGLYRDLVVVRKLDAEATALQRQGELGIWASLLGQEAAQVGSGRALRAQDMAFPTYREHGVLYCRGIDPIMPLGLFRGVDQGGWDPNEFKFNMYTIVIGAQTLHATGYAMGISNGRQGRRPTTARRSSPTSATAPPARATSTRRSSGPASSTPRSCSSARTTSTPSPSRWSGRPGSRCTSGPPASASPASGSTATTCSPAYAVTRTALDDARHGQGPTLIEAYTYRMGAHTTSDDPTRYRIASEVEAWQAKDPIARLRAFLEQAAASPTTTSSPRSTSEARGEAVAPARAGAGHARPGADRRCSTTSTRTARRELDAAARAVRQRTWPRSRGARTDGTETLTLGKALNDGPAPRAGGRPQGPHHGRGRRQARRRLPDHRRAAEGLRRASG